MALTDDDSAVDSLPVALAGTVILLAIIVALTAFGVRNATPSVAMASVDSQAYAMANDCRFLLALAPRPMDDPGAPPGAMRIERLDLPEGLEYLSFGFDPETGRRPLKGRSITKWAGQRRRSSSTKERGSGQPMAAKRYYIPAGTMFASSMPAMLSAIAICSFRA